MSQIKLLHSGGNGVILAAPASNPASDRTLTLPGDADGTILTSNSSTGKILQYKIVSKTNGISTTTTSHHEISSDFRTEITPTASNTIIVVQAEMCLGDVSGYTHTMRIVKNTASDFSGTTSNFMTPANFNNDYDGHVVNYVGAGSMQPTTMRVFETSGNTTARTYSIQWAPSGGTLYLNRWSNANYNSVSTFSVMEVSA